MVHNTCFDTTFLRRRRHTHKVLPPYTSHRYQNVMIAFPLRKWPQCIIYWTSAFFLGNFSCGLNFAKTAFISVTTHAIVRSVRLFLTDAMFCTLRTRSFITKCPSSAVITFTLKVWFCSQVFGFTISIQINKISGNVLIGNYVICVYSCCRKCWWTYVIKNN